MCYESINEYHGDEDEIEYERCEQRRLYEADHEDDWKYEDM